MSNATIALSGCPVAVGNIVVCMSVCNRDSHVAIENLKWQRDLGADRRFEFIIAHDSTLPGRVVKEMMAPASSCFFRVQEIVYSNPPIPYWPQGPNHAFQQTALFMQKMGRPWFWMEPDCIPLKYGWMESLEREYDEAHKDFMGPVVPGLGHINGVAIYPAATPRLLPCAMGATNLAWDSICKEQMIPRAHDASRMMQHVWGMNGDSFTPYGGDHPSFRTETAMKQILPSAVILHRCKDGSLIEQLRNRLHEN